MSEKNSTAPLTGLSNAETALIGGGFITPEISGIDVPLFVLDPFFTTPEGESGQLGTVEVICFPAPDIGTVCELPYELPGTDEEQ